jgi:hypothetical protein
VLHLCGSASSYDSCSNPRSATKLRPCSEGAGAGELRSPGPRPHTVRASWPAVHWPRVLQCLRMSSTTFGWGAMTPSSHDWKFPVQTKTHAYESDDIITAHVYGVSGCITTTATTWKPNFTVCRSSSCASYRAHGKVNNYMVAVLRCVALYLCVPGVALCIMWEEMLSLGIKPSYMLLYRQFQNWLCLARWIVLRSFLLLSSNLVPFAMSILYMD